MNGGMVTPMTLALPAYVTWFSMGSHRMRELSFQALESDASHFPSQLQLDAHGLGQIVYCVQASVFMSVQWV